MSKKSFGLGVFLGSVAGVASAYLLAQKSGDEMQEEVMEKINDSKNKIMIKYDEIKSSAESKFSEKTTDHEVYNPPVEYEATPETVSAPPKGTALPNDAVVVPDIDIEK